MKTRNPVRVSIPTVSTPMTWQQRLARRLVYRLIRHIKHGELTVHEGGITRVFGHTDAECEAPRADITITDPGFFTAVLSHGSLGACEAYMHGYWETSDLAAIIRLVVANRGLYHGMDRGLLRLMHPIRNLAHAGSRNTRNGSLRNIIAHYDLGNDFFALVLDDSMAYSCGIFEREDATLKEASTAKFDRLCRKLALTPSDHVVEIGTGWGGFALHAARNYGCRVTTTTISPEQKRFAENRIGAAGLADRVTVLDHDYRDLQGTFDKLVSIEMIEAVGHHYLTSFFRQCSRLLKPDGLMALQAITIPSQSYDRHKRQATFINRFVFPGSSLPSNAAMLRCIARRTDLRLVHMEDITPHYARTLRAWRENFDHSIEKIRKFWPGPAFSRQWQLYFCYCEASFAERYNGVGQYVFSKPDARQAPLLGPLERTIWTDAQRADGATTASSNVGPHEQRRQQR